MKTQILTRKAILATSILALTSPLTRAAVETWNNFTAGPNNWAVDSNWLDGTQPLGSDPTLDVIFPGGSGPANTNNDIASLQLNTLTLSGGALEPVTIAGNALDFRADDTGAAITQNGAGTVQISTPVVATGALSLGGTGTGLVTLSGVISGGGGLTFNAGNWLLANTGNTYTGGTTINTGAFVTISPAGAAPQSIAFAPAAASLLGGNSATNTLTINGGTLKLTTKGTGSMALGSGRPVTFGANGGLLDLTNTNTGSTTTHAGHIASGDLSLTLNNTAGNVAVIRFNGGDVGLSNLGTPNGGDWSSGGNTLRISGFAGSGGAVRFELNNGAMMRAGNGGTGTVTISNPTTVRGVFGGDPTSGALGTVNTAVTRTAGRFGLDQASIINYTGGLVFENSVQVAVLGAARAINGNITIAGTAGGNPGYVAFAGRSTGVNIGSAFIAPGGNTTGLNFLYLGQGGDDTMTIQGGGTAVLDIRFRGDQPDNHPVLLNAATNIQAGGKLRFQQSLSNFSPVTSPAPNTGGNVGNHVVQGTITGFGSTTEEAVMDLLLPAPITLLADETTAGRVPHGGVDFQASSALVINGTGFGGLRVNALPRPNSLFSGATPDPVGNDAKLSNYLTASRLAGVSGSGGYLTPAPLDVVFNFPAGGEWSDPDVGLKVVDSNSTGTDVSLAALSSWGRNLAVDAGATLNTGAGAFTLSGGTLFGTGTVTGSGGLTVASGATVSPGFSIGTLTTADLTLDGTLSIEATSAPAIDFLQVNGNLTLGGTSVLSFDPLNTYSTTDYVLAAYTGTLMGTFSSVLSMPAGYTLNYGSGTNDVIKLEYTLTATSTWDGTINGQWDKTTANWKTLTTFADGNKVVFDDTAAGPHFDINVTGGPVSPSQIKIDNSIATYSITASAGNEVTGTATLTKVGTGMATISGPFNHSGGTNINVGTLRLGSSNVLSDTAPVSVATGATFDVNGQSDTIGALTVNGFITPGSLTVNSLEIGPSVSAPTNFTLNGNVTKTGTASAILLGAINLGGAARNFTVPVGASPELIVAGVVDNGALTKSGDGTMLLAAANTYSGTTTVNEGTLRAGIAGAIPSSATIVTNTGATLDMNGFALTAASVTSNGTITTGGADITTPVLNGSGALQMDGGTLLVNGAAGSSFSGTISGTGTIVSKHGTGVLTLSGANTYTGGLQINTGRVNVNNLTAAGTGGTTVEAGAGLQFNNTLNGPVTVNGGTLSTGTTSNVINGNLFINATSTIRTHNEDTLSPSEFILTGTLRGTGNLLILPAASTTSADGGPGVRLRGGASDYSGTVTVGNRAKFELQSSTAGTFSPMGTGKIIMTAGTVTGGLAGTYSQFQPRLVVDGLTTTFGNDVEITGAGVVNFNILGNSNTTHILGELKIGGGQTAFFNKNDGVTTRTVIFPTVSLTGGNATFSVQDPSFGSASGSVGPNVQLGAINETVAGSGVVFRASGAPHVTVTGVSSYTGPTNVQTGALTVSASGSLASSSEIRLSSAGSKLNVLPFGSGGYSIPAGQVLSGIGDWDGRVNLDGTLAPGLSIGTISGDDFTFNAGGIMQFELSTVDSTSDLLTLTGAFDKGGTGTYLFDFEGGGASGQTYTLALFNTTTFSVTDFSYTDLGAGLTGTFVLNTNDLQFVVVPEPGAGVSLIGGLGLLVALRRRRG